MAAKTPEEEPKEVVEEVVVETPAKETTPEVETPETVETPGKVETPEVVETKEVEPDAKEEEEEFDVEEFKKETVEAAEKAVTEKIAASLGLTKKEEELSKEEGLIPPWEKRGETKPKSWKEHAEYSADLAEWKRDQRDKEIVKVQEEQETEAKEMNQKWQDYWDTELDELEKANKIPAIKDADDPNDPGKIARVKLFSKMHELGLKRQAEKLPPINSVKLIFYEHYTDGEPGGADAPISFGKGGAPVAGGDDYSYDDIKNKSFDQIKEEK